MHTPRVIAPAPYGYASLSNLRAVTVRTSSNRFVSVNAPVGLYVMGEGHMTVRASRKGETVRNVAQVIAYHY